MNQVLQTLRYAAPWDVFMAATIVVKLMVVIILISAIVVIAAAIQRRASNGPTSSLLSTLGIVALVAGCLGAAYDAFNTYVAYQMLGGVRLIVMLPSLIEMAYVLLFGVVVWAIARWGNAGAAKACPVPNT